MSHWRCCCGGSPPTPECPGGQTCTECGDLVFTMTGTFQRGPSLSGLYRRWVNINLSVKVRSPYWPSQNQCRWLSVGPPTIFQFPEKDGDFLGYSGSIQVVEEYPPSPPAPIPGPQTFRSASFSFDEAEIIGAGNVDSVWRVDSSCDSLVDPPFESFLMSCNSVNSAVPSDDQGNDQYDLQVGTPTFLFGRVSSNTCPVGIYTPYGVLGDNIDNFDGLPTITVSYA